MGQTGPVAVSGAVSSGLALNTIPGGALGIAVDDGRATAEDWAFATLLVGSDPSEGSSGDRK